MSLSSRAGKILFAVIAAVLFAAPITKANASVFVSVAIGPPVLPVYAQPPLPAPGYIWTPGYWAYGDAGYYWVPGVWVMPPRVGLLWTPGYWGFVGGLYTWHPGYWGPHVGFYGGVNYGFGYMGVGFCGGEWRGRTFAYNRAVANFGSVRVTNVYVDRTVVERNTIVNVNRYSFNGGGGIQARESASERQWDHERHEGATSNQMQQERYAGSDRSQLASVNHGMPGTFASSRVDSYHQVAERNAKAHPISGADRSAGVAYHPNQREANQDQRIANGLRSGQMTAGEASRAEKTQSAIDKQVRNDRVANGGTLTPQERQQVSREQNAASRQVYNEKHNDNTAAPNEVNDRMANQQQRTANGLRSGEMTSGEAGRSNANQSNTSRQVRNERVANGGALTGQERRQANREENRNSRQIRNERHNGAEARGRRR